MKMPLFCICVVAGLSAAAAAMSAFGQSQPSQGQSHSSISFSAATRNMQHLTPAEKAKELEMYRLAKSAAAALDAGEYAKAEADARKSLSLGIGSGLSQKLLGQALYAQGKTEEALKVYKTMFDERDYDPGDLLPYALLLLKTGHYARAVAAYNKALPFSDTLPHPKVGNPDDKSLMQLYSHFSPDNYQPKDLETDIHIGLALTYEADSWGRHSQLAKALAEYKKAIAIEPKSAIAHLYYAEKLSEVRKGVEATAEFKKAAELGSGAVKAMAENPYR